VKPVRGPLQIAIQILVAIYRGLVCYLGMTLTGIVSVFLYGVSFGKLRRFNAEVLSALSCRLMLALIGIKVKFPNAEDLPQEKVLYIFNHNSYLDVFLTPSLGLQRTRIVISTRTKKILPLLLCNIGTGALFIPFKNEPDERSAFFADLTERLRNGSDSVLASPEGVHLFRHGVSKFNEGIFEAAVASGVPLCPLFYEIPEESNPLESHSFRSGTVSIHVLPLIKTADWNSNNLKEKVQEVRELFLAEFYRRHPKGIL
jgi:1-acyl-sn-glycerol-3-phosphate acyltransferase